MQDHTLNEVRDETYEKLFSRTAQTAAEIRKGINETLKAKTEAGEILILTDEEMRLLKAFRAFKSRVKKKGSTFRWQVYPQAAEILISEETGLVRDLQDLSE